ncbi:endoplasmic reticulum resident protein 44 isoform X2 [Copidosoma floridanum]|uniref:endoplasmic reticulum resident protein 44 isoform X2 n=1 Tax=Copidosoma floridanum TaxID=29053 RepID=UPI0006C977D1|nr:endoplasmic reticulum resident protein 44 isoform X2 [Copidosoma floridanum]
MICPCSRLPVAALEKARTMLVPRFFVAVLVTCLLIFERCSNVNGTATQLNDDNVDMTLGSHEIVLVNFYADWCRFSNNLMPIFDNAAAKVREAFPEPGRVVLAKVDCDRESNLATKYHITKFPTLKIIRNGVPLKKEYRGKRSEEAFVEFIKKQLEDPIIEFQHIANLTNLDDKKRSVIGYFTSKDTPEYQILSRVAGNLKDDCQFHVGFGDASREMHPPGQSIVVFRPDKAISNENDETYHGSLLNYEELNKWAYSKCIPLVREITFENAEELTEEGLPFLILFYDPKSDSITVKQFKDIVAKFMEDDKKRINFLIANGHDFQHPLHHLGKSIKDLPLIAIDSFRHMYLFPENPIDLTNLNVNRLKQFIEDLHSGKLHREFHYGVEAQAPSIDTEKTPTTPPESTFKKLAPSKNRYTLLRDEL